MKKQTPPDIVITGETKFTLVNYWGKTVTHSVEKIAVEVRGDKISVLVLTRSDKTMDVCLWAMDEILNGIKAGDLTLVK